MREAALLTIEVYLVESTAAVQAAPQPLLDGRMQGLAVAGPRSEVADYVVLGGGNAGTEALIRDVSVVVDDPPEYITSTRNGNMRGIWLEEGDGVTVEGVPDRG